MKKKLLIIVAIMAIGHLSFSQTKRIMHRSHSGSDASLQMDESDDSYGITSNMKIELRKEDSIRAQKKADSAKAANTPKKNGADTSKALLKTQKKKNKSAK